MIPSQTISLWRLRFYEQEYRRDGTNARDAHTKSELGTFEDTLRRAAMELQDAETSRAP